MQIMLNIIIAMKKIIYFKTSEFADLILFNSYITRSFKTQLVSYFRTNKALNWKAEHNKQNKRIFLDSAEEILLSRFKLALQALKF